MARFTPIILILISVGLFFFFIDPTFTELKKIQKDAALYAKVLDQTRELERLRDELLNEYNTIDEFEREKLLKLLPNAVDTVRLVMDINGLAKEHNLTVKSLDITQPESKPEQASAALEELQFAFSVDATYEEFIKFMKALERSLRIIDVISINLSGSGIDNDKFDFKVSAILYWLR